VKNLKISRNVSRFTVNHPKYFQFLVLKKLKKGRLETSFVIGILQFGFFFLITAFKVFDVSNELKPLSNFYSVGFSK